MNSFPAATILRIKGVHFTEFMNPTTLDRIEKKLTELGFNLREKSFDGFIITYTRDEHTNENKNTLMYFDSAHNLADFKFTVVNPE